MTDPLHEVLEEVLGADYRIERELDGGGMSRLFLATEVRHDRPVVVKVLPPDLNSEQSAQRFKREIEIMARLQHPHVLPLLTSGSWNQGFFYITPFITGESLRARIARDGKLPFDDIVKILGDIGSALAFAHARGIVHRDIKPGNILFSNGESVLADFGIARFSAAAMTPITTSGVVLGTPAYMAPEMRADELADVYSLGVVGYEMLTGELPSRGMTAKEIIAARGQVAGDKHWKVSALAQLLAQATSPVITDRTASTEAFIDGLERVQKRFRIGDFAVPSVIGLATVAVVIAVVTLRSSHRELNPMRFVVASVGSAEPATIEVAKSIEERFGDWRDVNASNLAAAGDTMSATHAVSLRDAVAGARRIGARSLVLVDTRLEGDSLSIGATLYDAAGDSAIRARRATVGVTAPSTERVMPYRRLINSLLREDDPLPWRTNADRTQASLAAWKSYDTGRDALRAWRLEDAERAFRASVAADNSIGLAHLWLAQTLAWKDTAQRNETRKEALRAKAVGNGLRMRDSVQADGLVALVSDDWPDACTSFRNVIHRDSADFAGWIGIGDCETRDPAVLVSNRTATGFVFRSSFEDAARAYRRASDIGGPTASSAFRGWLLGRMQRVLVPATNRMRRGVLAAHDSIFMFARPYLDKDTVAYAPYSSAQSATLTGDPPHELLLAAVTRNRDVIRIFIEDWVRRSPTDPAGIDSLASWSESAGGFAQVDGHRVTTGELLRRARAIVTDSAEQVRLAAAEIRDLLRHGEFEQLQRKGDSLFRTNTTNRFPDLAEMAGVAALLGHLRETIRLLPLQAEHFKVPLPNGSSWIPPPPVEDAAAALETYASFGTPRDSIRSLSLRAAELIRNFVPNQTQADFVRSVLVALPLSYVDPRESLLPGFRLQPPDEATRAVLSLAVGDTAAARQELPRLHALQRLRMPGDGVGFAYRIATVQLALGDTISAIQSLDDIIATIPILNKAILSEVPSVGALIRTFALRARLARRVHDQATASKSAGIVQSLLKNADAELTPLMLEMRAIGRP